MSTFIKELKKIMSKFLDDIEVAIQNIHTANGVDNATVTKEVTDAVTAGVAPLQTQLTDQQNQINELQKALQDTVTALNSGNVQAAQATATAAVNAAAGTGSTGSAAGSGNAS
jgi:tetrahydromethanopterin S-methyltransferase subunit B